MPVGSPGMEMGDKFMPDKVLLLKQDGTHEIYSGRSAICRLKFRNSRLPVFSYWQAPYNFFYSGNET